MGAISDFVAAFHHNRADYLNIEKKVRELCEQSLQGYQFLWQSRVKAAESLEKKLRDRNNSYQNESKNVDDIKDLVGGRIRLARHQDFENVINVIRQVFHKVDQSQHPKLGPNASKLQARFRGYDGLHVYVKFRDPADEPYSHLLIEIQVMTGFMWNFSTLEHDIIYKQLHGQPSKRLRSHLESLQGVANLGEVVIQQFEEELRHSMKEMDSTPNQSDNDCDPNVMWEAAAEAANKVTAVNQNDKECIRALRLTDPREDKDRIEASKDRLLDGSCSWVFEDPAFVDWWINENSRIIWVHGDPGKGKTMMMMAITSELSRRLEGLHSSNTLSYFFCQNTNVDLNTTATVLRGLIYLLIDQNRALIRHVRAKYDSAGENLFIGGNAEYALRDILLNILKDDNLSRVYLMIDALNECDSDVHRFLQWIIEYSSTKVKWLITSRNEPAFTERLGDGRQLHTSLELNSSHVSREVSRFIEFKIKEIRDLKKYSQENLDFIQKELHEKADGTFLWVALVCEELRKARQYRAKKVLQAIPSNLDLLYTRMLGQVVGIQDEDDAASYRRILRLMMLAFRPLCLREISIFATSSNEPTDFDALEELIQYHSSFIIIRDQIAYFVHQSAKDYLESEKCSTIFQSGKASGHTEIADRCLELMSNTLVRNICQCKTSKTSREEVEGPVIDRCIPDYIQYSCLYWIDHFQMGVFRGSDRVLQFFRNHLLHWLEALSWVRHIFEIESMLFLLRSAVEVSMIVDESFSIQKMIAKIFGHQPSANVELLSFIDDATQFTSEFWYATPRYPLQIYELIHAFGPKASPIRHSISSQLDPWVEHYPSTEDWKMSLNFYSERVSAIKFSPTGQLLASASQDRTIRLWDLVTGTLQRTINSHTGRVKDFALSPTDRLLASASWGGNIKLWNPITGMLQNTLNGDLSNAINVVVFSPSGRLLASGLVNGTVRLWDPIKGITIQNMLEGYEGGIQDIAFSPDGRLLASISSWKTIRLWHVETNKLIKTFTDIRKQQATSFLNSSSEQLLFSADGSDLIIEETTCKITLPIFQPKTSSHLTQPVTSTKSSPLIHLDDQWIENGRSRSLLLPCSQLAEVYALHGNTLVIGTNKGEVLFFRFRV